MGTSIGLRTRAVATAALLLFVSACGSDAGPATSSVSDGPAATTSRVTSNPAQNRGAGTAAAPSATPITREGCGQLRRDWIDAFREDGRNETEIVQEYQDAGCEEMCGPFLDQEGDARDNTCPSE